MLNQEITTDFTIKISNFATEKTDNNRNNNLQAIYISDFIRKYSIYNQKRKPHFREA